MSSKIVIKVTNLSKCYHIYAQPHDRLKQSIYPRLQRLVGKQPKQYFREFWAMKEVSFEIKKGETVGIIGRNGCGKSTLLQMICGTLNPTGGSIQAYGRIAALLELGSGFNPEFTGRENVYMNAAVLGLTKEEIDARYEDIVAFADIDEFIDQPTKVYSSGMVVRLAFSTAIHVEPDILIVDEALAVGDTAFQQKCLTRIRQMQQSGVSILLVTHSTNILAEYCDRGIFLRNGNLILDCSCEEAIKAYADDLVAHEGGVTSAPQIVRQQSGVTSELSDLKESALTNMPNAPNVPQMHIETVQFLNEKEIESTLFEHGDVVRIAVTLRINQTLTPCFGIQIKSTEGIGLWAVNTEMMDIKLMPLPPGIYTYCWDLHANFSGNRYVVALGAGVMDNSQYRRIHRLDYAGYFDVMPQLNKGGGWLAPEPIFNQPVEVMVIPVDKQAVERAQGSA